MHFRHRRYISETLDAFSKFSMYFNAINLIRECILRSRGYNLFQFFVLFEVLIFNFLIFSAVKPPSEAIFFGKEYVEYKLIMNNEAATTTQETINFSFRTKYSNGFLFHSGMHYFVFQFDISLLVSYCSTLSDMHEESVQYREEQIQLKSPISKLT